MRSKFLIPLVVVAAVLSFAGSCDQKGLGDAPVGNAYEAPRDVIVMPDTFPNLVVVCDGPTRIWVTTREAPPVKTDDHPLCRGQESLQKQGKEVPYPTDSEE